MFVVLFVCCFVCLFVLIVYLLFAEFVFGGWGVFGDGLYMQVHSNENAHYSFEHKSTIANEQNVALSLGYRVHGEEKDLRFHSASVLFSFQTL